MYHVILAGGSGSRFWPKSRENTPKQLLKILGEETMIRLTYNRLREIADLDKIFVVASAKLSKLIHNDIPEIPEENFIIEPSGKNTAPAIGLAALHIFKRDSNAIMGVYPADHLIIGDSKFKNIITNAQKMVEQKPCLITIGIEPTYPATGYGYIQYDSNKKMDVKGVYKVKTFAEKPEKETAEKLVQIAQRSRNLKGHGLDEGISTRLLVYAAQLINKGVDPKKACTMALITPLTDDDDILDTLLTTVDTFFE